MSNEHTIAQDTMLAFALVRTGQRLERMLQDNLTTEMRDKIENGISSNVDIFSFNEEDLSKVLNEGLKRPVNGCLTLGDLLEVELFEAYIKLGIEELIVGSA
ncbi:hypothetical protein AB4383_08005 [Vibrio breoganii]